MHYFPSRQFAGDLLAEKLVPKYRYEDCVVVALNDGAVLVGAQIAMHLHCSLTMLLTTPLKLQGENDVLAEIDHFGGVTYNRSLTEGELDEIRAENFNYIEQQKLEKMFDMNRLLGDGGIISADMLRNRNVIVVSDGLVNSLELRALASYIKPIRIQKLIVATPFANIPAVDEMHIVADEIVCLNVIEDVISVDHYYEDNTLPPHDTIIRIIESIILNWK